MSRRLCGSAGRCDGDRCDGDLRLSISLISPSTRQSYKQMGLLGLCRLCGLMGQTVERFMEVRLHFLSFKPVM